MEMIGVFELAEEYHGMGVLANREASWEEAQYYFEKCLKILATLDVDENDTKDESLEDFTKEEISAIETGSRMAKFNNTAAGYTA